MKICSTLSIVISIPLLFINIETSAASNSTLEEHASRIRNSISTKILPFWYRNTIDTENGGYLLGHDSTKQLVTQARMVWSFAKAHNSGYEHADFNYLSAAVEGHEFLINNFRDTEHGGFFWTTDPSGAPINTNKIMYGQAFVIYALVELHRATGDDAHLDEAIALFRNIRKFGHDDTHGGWIEHFTPDWTPIMQPNPTAIVEIPGLKSANTHLHLMEAFTELYRETKRSDVRRALEESARINSRFFYPSAPGESCFHRKPDWSPVTGPGHDGLSYGHNVEFAWLLVQAEKALNRDPSWSHVSAIIDHALEYGYDHSRGGLYYLGNDNTPASDKRKIWWVQAEMLSALTEQITHSRKPRYTKALKSLLNWINKFQTDQDTGIWYDTVAETGEALNPALMHNWKGAYHDLRALLKFSESIPAGKASCKENQPVKMRSPSCKIE
ncbi:MAG: AGE family epimerase/isomerase [Verrucomicrobia bacterium]|nr:AGE family epimerase/isomerase [Verrucomicrobiota bacterium]